MLTYVIANQKGGVGKTTTVLALASLFSKKGKRVLLVDADPQGNASDVCQARIDGVATLYDAAVDKDRCPPGEAIQRAPGGWDIIPSDPLLRRADECLLSDPEGIYRIADLLSSLDSAYDVAVIDTAPTLNSLLYNALVAGKEVIVPVCADRFSIAGLAKLYEAVSAVQRRQNKGLSIAGLLLVKYGGRTNLSKAAKEAMAKHAESIGTRLFSSAIRECVKCQEAQAARTDLFGYAPSCTTALDYKTFFDELNGCC